MRHLTRLAHLILLAGLAAGAPSHAEPAAEPVPPHQSFTLESTALKETRRINVYLPPGYDAEARWGDCRGGRGGWRCGRHATGGQGQKGGEQRGGPSTVRQVHISPWHMIETS